MLDDRWGDEETELADGLRALLAKECTTTVVREAEHAHDGRSAALEARLQAFGLAELPPTPAVLAAVAWELGRALVPVPFVETAAVRAVLAIDAAYGLEGVVPASVARAVVADADGIALATVEAEAARRTTAGDFLAPVGRPAGERVGGLDESDRLRRLVRLLASARVVGAADALLALGVDYVKRREQFGRPVGAFQAVAHRLADAATAVDGTALLVRKAAWVADEAQRGDGAPSPVFATMAWAKAVETGRHVATAVHQCMGGYGFAIEYDCQLFTRRIRSWSMRLGDPGAELAELARVLLDPPRRDVVTHLWHHDLGVPVPRWSQELDSA